MLPEEGVSQKMESLKSMNLSARMDFIPDMNILVDHMKEGHKLGILFLLMRPMMGMSPMMKLCFL